MSSSATCHVAGSSGLPRARCARSRTRKAVIASKARHLQWWQLKLKLTGTPYDCPMHKPYCSMHKPYGMRQGRGN